MDSSDPQPDPDPDETRAELTESEPIGEQSDNPSGGLPLSRRAALATLVGFGGVSVLSSPAAAGPKQWKNDVDANGNTLFNLGALEMIDDPVIASTDGTPLALRLNGERVLRLAPTPDRSGANVLFGHPSNAIPSEVEGGTVSGGGFTESDGASRPNRVLGDFATVGGGRGNTASSSHTTIGGGREHAASGKFATVGGGNENTVSAVGAAIGGGIGNTASEERATIGGGLRNTASGLDSVVAGGIRNTASGQEAGILGGRSNTASARSALVVGNGAIASDRNSFAAGDNAAAEDRNAFVWNDASEYHSVQGTSGRYFSSSQDIAGSGVTGRDTFHASARGGFRFVTGGSESPNVTYISRTSAGWTTTSTRTRKTNVDPVDPEEVLAGVEKMEVSTWEYKNEDGEGQGTRHIGPMAEDFHEAVDVGDSDEHINSINADGVALAAIQGLSAKLDEKDDQIDDLEAESERKDERIDAQRERINELGRENEQLRERLTAVENQLTGRETSETSPASADD